MGHTEHYEFTDMRSGEYGVTYSAPTQAQLQITAQEAGYSGPFRRVVRAFPPSPPASVLKERAEREQLGYAPDEPMW